jgi:protein gp37
MADKSKIEWTDATWNPIRGCSVVSEGCRNCYAMQLAARFSQQGQAYEDLAYRNESGAHWTGKVRLIHEHLGDPLRWTKPRRIFVNSMSDLFHESIPDKWIYHIFDVMYSAKQHTFQILTKRPERMLRCIANSMYLTNSPLPNVWLGVSIEDQMTADERIPLLLQTPAAVRWISAEPLLGPVELTDYFSRWRCSECGARDYLHPADSQAFELCADETISQVDRLDWVVVGGESGASARWFGLDNAREIIQECKNAEVPVFIKQLGAHPVDWRNNDPEVPPYEYHLTARKGGDVSEWPEDLRIREYPLIAEIAQ